ncbi:phospholipase effector Tle1 domain-containing protein [Aminobacter sp. BE322]|uniref:phospholipase effector Tle1 domain-containing protein n=1 Tax=unclassified Aminobacter TaxID=2644704 RepID=UPI003D21384F
MPESASAWVLIFSDGTGQRGVRADDGAEPEFCNVRHTNVFQMYAAIDGRPGVCAFYDAGLGAPEAGTWGWTRTLRNLWSKATGWGITANIVDCYEALMLAWEPGMKIGCFGFSRGAYTVRCLGGVLATCGIATSDNGAPVSRDKEGAGARRRRAIADEAVATYKIKEKPKRQAAGAAFVASYAAAEATPDVIGVFDTVRALGLPGIMNVVNPFRHEFHDNELSVRIPVGLHALSVDENRKSFAPVLWEDVDAAGRARGQVIEQCWFPGVHSDIGGGYDDDDRLSHVSFGWMLDRVQALAGLDFPLAVDLKGKLQGAAHDERTGFGIFWRPAERTVRTQTADIDRLCPDIEQRFEHYVPDYRPEPLRQHPHVKHYY